MKKATRDYMEQVAEDADHGNDIITPAMARDILDSDKKQRATIAELAGLRAKVAQLESNIDRSVCLDAEGERIHFGARVVCGQCFGSQGQHLKNARAERDSLKAQLADAEKVMEAVREYDNPTKERSHWTTVSEALAAYDAKWRAGK